MDSDLTYIKTKSGWLYLTVVIDLADRKIIGWAFSNNMTASETTVKALKMAIRSRGIQYGCDAFKDLLKKNKIIQSISRKGNCRDNSVAESFF